MAVDTLIISGDNQEALLSVAVTYNETEGPENAGGQITRVEWLAGPVDVSLILRQPGLPEIPVTVQAGRSGRRTNGLTGWKYHPYADGDAGFAAIELRGY